MKTYFVMLAGGAELQVVAARFQVDGSGTRFFDEAGELVAFWGAGMVQACFAMPAQAEAAVGE